MNGPFYYASRKPLKPGTKIRPFDHSRHDKDNRELEELFERVRREEFPERPPRIGSVFLCPDRSGFCSGSMSRPYVYEVEVKGSKKVFWADAENWTSATYRGDEESWARQYWKQETSRSSRHFFKEVLVHGGAVIVKSRVNESIVESVDRLFEAKSWTSIEAFFRRWPKLKKYAPKPENIRFEESPDRRRPTGTHVASQIRDKIYVWPKFWDLEKYGTGVMDWVIAHEIGHFHSSSYSSWGSKYFIRDAAKEFGIDIIAEWDDLPYGQLNSDEAFAECFAAYFMEKSELKRRYPRWFKFVESALTQ